MAILFSIWVYVTNFIEQVYIFQDAINFNLYVMVYRNCLSFQNMHTLLSVLGAIWGCAQPKCHRLVICQFCQLVVTCQQVATKLSISSSCNKSVKIRLETMCSKPMDSKFWQSICNKLFENLQQTNVSASCFKTREHSNDTSK